MSTDTKDDDQKDWSQELKDMDSDAIKSLLDQAMKVLKKRDDKPASELTNDELQARIEKLKG
jgi:hypothetical protein